MFNHFTIMNNGTDWIILGSSPAKANILLEEEKLEISPYSDKIVAAEISPKPGIDNILGLSSLIIVEICLSIGSILSLKLLIIET